MIRTRNTRISWRYIVWEGVRCIFSCGSWNCGVWDVQIGIQLYERIVELRLDVVVDKK